MLLELLRTDFEEAKLDASPSSMAAVLPSGSIAWVNRAWQRRAEEYGLGSRGSVGASYFEAITPPLRAFYEGGFSEALTTATVFETDYECPSPVEQRTFRLRVLPLQAAGWLVEHALMVARPAEAPIDPADESSYRNAQGMITQCSNCRRTLQPSTKAWHWIPAWIAQPNPKLSHGLCPACAGFFWGTKLRSR